MSKKILLFESDAAFAKELTRGFAERGAETEIVDDGNAGLELARNIRPNLILLSIELPRMNGFSVCNKLKKNQDLRDIPLVIMSSEATEETFEQHRKLRTRAEDYIRKPFRFPDLLAKISGLIELGPPDAGAAGARPSADDGEDEDGISIDEEIAIDDLEAVDEAVAEELDEVDGGGGDATSVDDVAAFADKAFDSIIMPGDDKPAAAPAAAPEVSARNGAKKDADDDVEQELDPDEPTDIRRTPQRGRASAPPAAEAGPSNAEWIAIREELEELREKASQVENLRRAAADAERFKSEVEELRKKVVKGGGVSSREFLDLREQLNRKDKEILDLKDALNHRDKQILDVRDRLTAIEREKADTEEALEERTQALDAARERGASLESDKETVAKRAHDLQVRLERSQTEGEKVYRELEEQKKRREQLAAEKDAAIAALKADHARAIESLGSEKDAASAEALRRQDSDALSNKAEALGGLQRQHDEEIGRLRKEHAGEIQALDAKHAAALEEADEKRKTELRLADDAKREALELAALEAQEAVAERERALTAKAEVDARTQTDRHGREMAVLGSKLAETEGKLTAALDVGKAEKAGHEATQATLAERETGLAETKKDLAKTRERLEDTTRKLDTLRGEHQTLETRNAANEERALRALQRIRDDSQVIDRAKKALAIGLALLDEQSEKPVES